MLLASERLNTIHVSTHVSLEEATRRASRERLLAVIEAAMAHFTSVGIADPRIAVAGLNPHCGEGGIFGQQEIETIGPAVAEAAARYAAARGRRPTPSSPSTMIRGTFRLSSLLSTRR